MSEAAHGVAEAVLRAMHEESVEELIHPDAEMRLLVSYGEPVRGRQEIAAALRHGRESGLFYVRVNSFEWLDPQTSLTTAFGRYPLAGGGFAEGQVCWIDEMRDGLVWRVRVFKTEPKPVLHTARSTFPFATSELSGA